jgi:UDPglucose 6-dehydrogenase
MLSCMQSPIEDAEIEHCLQHKRLNFKATLNMEKTYLGADYVLIATPQTVTPNQLLQHQFK